MSDKKSYSDARFWEDPKAIVVDQQEPAPEEVARQRQFDKDVAKLLVEGKIKFAKE